VKANSWHGRLAFYYHSANLHPEVQVDICTYSHWVFWGTVKALLITAYGGLIAFLAGHDIAWVAALVKLRALPDAGDLLAIVLVLPLMAAVSLFVVGFVFGSYHYGEWKKAKRKAKKAVEPEPYEPDFLTKLWESWSGKMCFRVDFSDRTELPTWVDRTRSRRYY
jgi:hypothetical protein